MKLKPQSAGGGVEQNGPSDRNTPQGAISRARSEQRAPVNARTRQSALHALSTGVLGFALAFGGSLAHANPPAPYNLVYGVVRDQYGTPLTSASAQIVLQTPSGVLITASVVPGYAPGVNYRMKVPMDSGDTPDLYQPSALLTTSPFKLFVVINNVTNLPIEMTVSYATLGEPGKSTRIDLTLGVDANGDGIPDAWEWAFLATLGLDQPLSSLKANSVLTGDGLTLSQQYLYGTYPFNPSQPCVVTFAGFNGASPILQFPTMTGRYYTVLTSTDAKKWSTVSFFLPTDDQTQSPRAYYYAPGIANAEVHVVPPGTVGQTQFYRVLVQ